MIYFKDKYYNFAILEESKCQDPMIQDKDLYKYYIFFWKTKLQKSLFMDLVDSNFSKNCPRVPKLCI